MEPETVGYAVGGLGILSAIAQMAWNKFFSSSGQANEALYAQLKEQLAGFGERVERLEGEIDDERKLRRMAQNRIARLELELAKHGIEIPPEGE